MFGNVKKEEFEAHQNKNSQDFETLHNEVQALRKELTDLRSLLTIRFEDLVKKTNEGRKEAATVAGEPYVAITSVSTDNPSQGGSIELDWNDIFVAKLMRAGFVGKTEADIVDQWFQEVCRGVVAENWEQEEANNAADRRTGQLDANGRRSYE